MRPAKRPTESQEALFSVPAGVQGGSWVNDAVGVRGRYTPTPIEWPGGIRPWDPIDKADEELGWQHPFVTPRRAYEIRREVEHGHR